MTVSIIYHANCLDASLTAFMVCKAADMLNVKYKLTPTHGYDQLKEESSHTTILIDVPIKVEDIEKLYADSNNVVVFDRKLSAADMLDGTGFYDIRLRTGGRLTVFNDGKTPSCKNVHSALRSKAGVKLMLHRGTSDLEKAVIRNVLANPRLLTWMDAVSRKDSHNKPSEHQLSICSLLSKERFLNRGFDRLLQMDDQEYGVALQTELCAYIAKREDAAVYVGKCQTLDITSAARGDTYRNLRVYHTEAPGNLNTEVTHQLLNKSDADIAMAYHFNHKKHMYGVQFRLQDYGSDLQRALVLDVLCQTLNSVAQDRTQYTVKSQDDKTMILFMNEQMLKVFTGNSTLKVIYND